MASRKSIEWNLDGFTDLRKSPEMVRAMEGLMARIQGDLGDDYVAGVEDGGDRARGYAVTATGEAKRDNAENNSLLRALGRAGV